jgi:hypothetical protein
MEQKEEKKMAETGDDAEIHEARQGLLRALQRNLAPKFSSTPITIQKNMGGEADTATGAAATSATNPTVEETAAAVMDQMEHKSSSLIAGNHSVLTESEKLYLEALLISNDPALLLTASQTLNDATLFPPPVDPVTKGGDDDNGQPLSLLEQQQPQENDETSGGSGGLAPPVPLSAVSTATATAATSTSTASTTTSPRTAIKHRDSGLQQQLFRLHEMTNTSAKPSQVLQRMAFMSQRNNSILATEDDALGGLGTGSGTGGASSDQLAAAVAESLASGAWDMDQDESEEPQELEDYGVGDWNPFKDISCKYIHCTHLRIGFVRTLTLWCGSLRPSLRSYTHCTCTFIHSLFLSSLSPNSLVGW